MYSNIVLEPLDGRILWIVLEPLDVTRTTVWTPPLLFGIHIPCYRVMKTHAWCWIERLNKCLFVLAWATSERHSTMRYNHDLDVCLIHLELFILRLAHCSCAYALRNCVWLRNPVRLTWLCTSPTCVCSISGFFNLICLIDSIGFMTYTIKHVLMQMSKSGRPSEK